MADIVLDTIAKTLNNSAKYKKEIAEIDTKLNNITRAIEQGILYDGLLEKVRTLKESLNLLRTTKIQNKIQAKFQSNL